jgi:hypothetical protein
MGPTCTHGLAVFPKENEEILGAFAESELDKVFSVYQPR